MKRAVGRRLLGLATGAALIGAGAAELAISRADYGSSRIQPYCQAGLCPDQFSLERVFEISQKATLGDARGELEDFKRAVTLSPASAYRWADLSEAEFNLRDYKQANYAIAQALEAGPRSPVILMRAANLYFQMNQPEQVVTHLRKLLSDPELQEYYETAFLTYSRLGLPVDQILAQGIPQRKDVVSRLLTFWTKVNKVDEAIATWKWAHERSLATDESAGDFFNFLIKADQQAVAQQLWQQSVGSVDPDYRHSNWIYNPGFEVALRSGPFDWTINDRHDVEALRVSDVAASGKWSFRIRFNGESNTAYHQTYQDMVLPPGRYKIRAVMKTDQVTTDEGVKIHIFDQPSQSKMNVWTDTVLGTQNWKQIEKTFDVPELKLVRIEIARLSSNMFDNKICGTTWVDDLSLSRQ